ncbi:MAG: ATP-binding protein [Candidatus Tectimicrobiota bacterium]
MRLTIFWRVILAQSILIALVLGVSLYAFTHFQTLARLSTEIVHADATSITEEKHLLKLFVAQMRVAEKYLLWRDEAFYQHFLQGSRDMARALDTVSSLVSSTPEHELLALIRRQYARYAAVLASALLPNSSWEQEKAPLSDSIIMAINDLLHVREQGLFAKATVARDHAIAATNILAGLSISSISTALLLAYLHARSLSRPLTRLARALLQIGQGQFHAGLVLQGPRELRELAQSFNRMALMLAELDQMKADFIAHMSHELRTPLTGIKEGTALLLEQIPGSLTAAQQRILEVVQTHSARLFRSVATLLDLSKMEAGMLEYVRTPSDVGLLLSRSASSIQLPAQKKGLHVEVCCASPLPVLALDEEKMQEALENVLSNAVKFTPEGGTIRLSGALQHTDRGRVVVIQVADTGKGLPSEDVQRIFDKFYQSPYHRQEHRQGTGLGLTIAKYIVEAHGGSIWAESQLGEGTTFTLALPVEAPGTPRPPQLAAPAHG